MTPRREGDKSDTVSVAIHDLARLRRIFAVITRHGFHQFVGRRGVIRFLGKRLIPPDDPDLNVPDAPGQAARRFRRVLEELGPTFIKMGQLLSTRPDLLPPEFVVELEALQDDAPPLPFEQIRGVIESSLGAPVEALYAEIDETPLAAASIAQVHAARTPSGTEVVVKVIRPGIADLIAADLDLLHLLARMLEAAFAELELYAPGDLVATFDAAIKEELDFRGEAALITEMAEALAPLRQVAVPHVEVELSSAEVLTMQRLVGRKVTAVEPGSPAAKRLVRIGLEATFRQIFEVGLFHGDPHPGNMLLLDDGRLGLIDFGLVGRLTASQQGTLVNLLVAVVAGDVDGVARVVLKMGRPLGRVNLSDLRETVQEIRRRHLARRLKDVDAARLVQDLIAAGRQHRIRVAPEYAVLAKAAVTVEGVLRAVDPDLDVVGTAKPYATKLMQRQLSGRALAERGLRSLTSLAAFGRDVPQQLEQVLLDLNAGALRIEVRSESLDGLGTQLNALGTRLVMGLLAAGLFVSAALLVRDDPWPIVGIPVATLLALVTAVSLSVVGLGWHAVGARSGKLSLAFLAKLMKRRRRSRD